MQTPTYGFVVTLDKPISAARTDVEAALKEEGFGVLTEIDVQATLKKKLDVDFAAYQILGACNPKLAYRALSAQPNIGLLLPCNVTLHEIDGETRVSIVDPLQMLGLEADNPELLAIAGEAETALRRVEQRLASA